MADLSVSSSRRTFLGAAAAALFAGVTLTILGCNDDSSTGNQTEAGGISGSIADNHGHVAKITKAQLDAGGAVTLDIKGSAGHTHKVSLTADDMTTLKGGGMVTVETSPGGSPEHTHSIMFM